jgi:hypothetical protein
MRGGRQMTPDRATGIERFLTWLGLWGAMRVFSALLAAVLGAILTLECLVPSAARLFPDARPNALHFFAVGIGLLLGLIGHFVADVWDRLVFEAAYGPHGRWITASRPPLAGFPAGEELRHARSQAAHALPRKPESDAEMDREAVKVARRQAERWERIERPLILARVVRGLLWPGLFAAALSLAAAALVGVFHGAAEGLRLFLMGGGYLCLTLLLLIPYARLRVEYLLRLYQDVAAHPAHPVKRKAEHR